MYCKTAPIVILWINSFRKLDTLPSDCKLRLIKVNDATRNQITESLIIESYQTEVSTRMPINKLTYSAIDTKRKTTFNEKRTFKKLNIAFLILLENKKKTSAANAHIITAHSLLLKKSIMFIITINLLVVSTDNMFN